MRSGPASLVLVAGQQLWRLPQPLATASHAFVWPWDLDAVRAHVCPEQPAIRLGPGCYLMSDQPCLHSIVAWVHAQNNQGHRLAECSS